ncbi:MAG: imelysin family protein [Candidatus Azotimanducaceae bacterium]|uniref:Imelysin-like domain-containing protein n=1 Tax=OM182 bacterium TaxID=2510334 RepID=A0A520S595_9GAMM|nr:hypothetical protein [Gammaproteobacteria bacterium]OUV68656.1 MAG: hypothetical protein CBC93_01130 [Gammaproteobacteria bacterium TMED133]RZO77657.1 MAG: hypothetical protein EVA68_00060 [OM182 bacterium]
MVNNQPKALTLLFYCLLTTSCSQESPESNQQNLFSPIEKLHTDNRTDAKEKFESFKVATDSFLANPTAKTLTALKEKWVKAHNGVLKFQFLANPSSHESFTRLIDSWPIEPGFIDTLPLYPKTGIVSDVTITINEEAIRKQHQFTDHSEAAIGFHVIEYLIFSRSLEEFIPEDDYRIVRRRLLLSTLVSSLAKDLDTYLDVPQFDKNSQPTLGKIMEILENGVSRLHQHSLKLLTNPHSAFSNKSRTNLQNQISIVEKVVFEPANLGSELVYLDEVLARDIIHTIRELSSLINSETTDEEIAFQCSSLLEGLKHQLRSLITILKLNN